MKISFRESSSWTAIEQFLQAGRRFADKDKNNGPNSISEDQYRESVDAATKCLELVQGLVEQFTDQLYLHHLQERHPHHVREGPGITGNYSGHGQAFAGDRVLALLRW